MNADYQNIHNILLKLRVEYSELVKEHNYKPQIPITERDIVSEIYYRLKEFCSTNETDTHTEVKTVEKYIYSGPVDNVILHNTKDGHWLSEAIKIQDKYNKGSIEARFSTVPIKFFHTAIEVKIQSNVTNAKKDIDTLKSIQELNPNCNCFFVLLNARGKANDHQKIIDYSKEKNVGCVEFSLNIEKKTV